MAQHDYSIANQSGAAFRTDLNDALSAIVSSNSGAAAPATTYAYMPWADTTNSVYKIRNATNNAWISLYQFDGAWSTLTVRRNTAEDGIILQGRTGGTGTFAVTVTPPTLTASRTLTLADGNTTLTAGTMVPTSQVATTSAAGIVQLTDSTSSTSTTTAATPNAVKSAFDRGIPSGTVMLFVQSTAPTGWTKSTAHNDKALRVVSGNVANGGTTGFSSVFGSRTPSGSVSGTNSGGSVSAFTLTTTELPAHQHNLRAGRSISRSSVAGANGSNDLYRAGTGGSDIIDRTDDSTGGGGSHAHGFTNPSWSGSFAGTAMDFAVAYVDVIIATKD